MRRALAALALVLLAASAYAFLNLGRFFTAEDPLARGDAIFVLAGTFMNRPLEAVDLYREGWAPVIVLSYGIQERAVRTLVSRGRAIETFEDQSRTWLMAEGVPATAILQPPRVHDNTAQEAATLRQLAMERGWRRVIVVSSSYHLRRARFAIRRELEGTAVEVVMQGTRYERITPERWWRSRDDLRWILSEGPKLLAYLLGLGA
ncbi:MAG: YdcF family protein [Vicinamibacterales bacterium]